MMRGLLKSGVLVLCFLLINDVAAAQTEQYLGDIADSLQVTQGWGKLGIDTAVRPPNGQTPNPLRIGEKIYEHGLGHHAPGEIVVPLLGRYLAFTCDVGVLWQGGDRGSVVFEVWVDDEKRFSCGPLNDSDPPQSVDVPLEGAQTLRLVAGDAGDGISCDVANWADARLMRDTTFPTLGKPSFVADGKRLDDNLATEGSFALIGFSDGGQIALSRNLGFCTMAVGSGNEARVTIPVTDVATPFTVTADVVLAAGSGAEACLSLASGTESRVVAGGDRVTLSAGSDGTHAEDTIVFAVSGANSDAAVRWTNIRYTSGKHTIDLELFPAPVTGIPLPLLRDVEPRPALETELIEWDWRLQDGIGAGATRDTFAQAVVKLTARGDALLADLRAENVALDDEAAAWEAVRDEAEAARAAGFADEDPRWEGLWRRSHRAIRQMAFANPLAQAGPMVFVKQAPGVFSHQLTQYYGHLSRPGGGVYVLDHPGVSMQLRRLAADAFPAGNFMHPEVTHDGQRILVAFCAIDSPIENRTEGRPGSYYRLYEMNADGSGVVQLTDGPYDDFSPKELPNGQVVFISTRRGGWHRCGNPGCEVYTLTLLDRETKEARTVSFHETQEWDPAVLNDGRVIYTRWDYVDRNAVHYQQLWTVRPDGSAPAAFYGNNTFNPVGVWEARPVPGSPLVMATAAPHHGLTAGSIILVDVRKGVDDLEPLTRLTPEVPFPESEALLLPHWRSALKPEPPARSPEMDRWPGQCFRSAYPLSEKYFYAAYSFDPLIGEPTNSPANMFGLYLVDAFGNKELVYRDLNIASAWPIPLRPRAKAPVIAPAWDKDAPPEGTYYVQNVYESDPGIERGNVERLRIVQVLPKSTPGANNPMVGAANASPGKQVLGTVPVEEDGSAYFTAPAGVALAFQTLDELGQATQVMRSVTYLQPGERASCVGCHEHRLTAPPSHEVKMTMASRRAPSTIEPAPDGSLPLSYPILVQPVLDSNCVECHSGEKPAGPADNPIVLTGDIDGKYTKSYNALVARVSYAAWGRGAFPEGNSEPLAQPGFFGARGSDLMKMLLEGHHEVELSKDDMERLTTWIDANALFYGTFNFEDQARQQRGERIAGPDLE